MGCAAEDATTDDEKIDTCNPGQCFRRKQEKSKEDMLGMKRDFLL